MSSRRVGVALALIACLLLLGAWLVRSGPGPNAASTAPPSPAPASPAPPSTAPTATATPTAAPPSNRVRIPIRTLVRLMGAAPAASAPSEAPPHTLTDRREHPPRDAAEERAAIEALLHDVDAASEACVASLHAAEPARTGQVKVAFQLDQDGITDAWVYEPADVPAATLDCLANAVNAEDWQDIVESPGEITRVYDLAE